MTALADLSAEALAARLSGTPEERAALVAEAAAAGYVEAQALLGQILLDGNGIAADPRAALDWFTRAAAQHHLMALNMVGRCYDLGWGTQPDKTRAAECYRIAAERGLAEGMYNYATLLALGQGVREDRPLALAWFRKAAALGYAKADNFIGSFAEDGWVEPRDMAAAAACYARAASGGDFRGCFNHARMLLAAGHPGDAIGWVEQAARLGHDRFRAQMRDWFTATPHAAAGHAAIARGATC